MCSLGELIHPDRFDANKTIQWKSVCSVGVCLQGNPYAWCATAVDANGVMLPQRTGVCDDERNVAYDGPGKLEYTKLW